MIKDDWHTVGGHLFSFDLYATSTVLFSYALPVTQHKSPKLDIDEWTYQKWSSIAARVVVDSIPYVHSGSLISGNVPRKDSLRGQLVVTLPAGVHTVALEWKSLYEDSSVAWMTLNQIDDGFAGGDNLLIFINRENTKPSIWIPDYFSLPITGEEDEKLSISVSKNECIFSI